MNRKGKCSANEEIKGKPTKRKDQLKCGMLLLPASGIGRREGGIGIGKEGGGVFPNMAAMLSISQKRGLTACPCVSGPMPSETVHGVIYARDLQVSAKLPPFKIGVMLTVRLGYKACIDG